MDPTQISLVFTIIGACISVAGAIVSFLKLKPEKRKMDADAGASIGDAAQSVADGARVTVEMLMNVKKELEESLKRERMAYQAELKQVRDELKDERQARVRLQNELAQERQARIKAENRMTAFQKWLNLLLAQLEKAEIPPSPPPYEWTEDAAHNSLP
jgi:hypothetical protein